MAWHCTGEWSKNRSVQIKHNFPRVPNSFIMAKQLNHPLLHTTNSHIYIMHYDLTLLIPEEGSHSCPGTAEICDILPVLCWKLETVQLKWYELEYVYFDSSWKKQSSYCIRICIHHAWGSKHLNIMPIISMEDECIPFIWEYACRWLKMVYRLWRWCQKEEGWRYLLHQRNNQIQFHIFNHNMHPLTHLTGIRSTNPWRNGVKIHSLNPPSIL